MMISQATYKNLVVNPSGPGALSGGSSLMIFRTSYLVKQALIPDASRLGRSRNCRLIPFDRDGGTPISVSK
jgi:hypothetical protein